MTVNKITNPPTPQEQINKINEIIDAIPTVDSSLSDSSTNPVQNKVITSALASKTLVTIREWS